MDFLSCFLRRESSPQQLRIVAIVFLVALILSSFSLMGEESPQDRVFSTDEFEFFENKIRPLLVEKCIKCHGEGKQWAGLRLDSRSAMIVGGDNGQAMVVGRPDASELISRVTSREPEQRMPPPEDGSVITPEQIDALKHWILIGAPWPLETKSSNSERKAQWDKHWAFTTSKSVGPVPLESLPASFPEWIENPIDQFVLKRLTEKGFRPATSADPLILVRRLTYTLTGLPPSEQSIEEFVGDPSAENYGSLVDRLLDSYEYGEHWGRHWLDVARYSDTKGYVYDREEKRFVHASHYRDWVIDAFNRDLPYDKFVLYQLAADQVPGLDRRDLAAMGFLTLGRRFLGVAPDIIDDRIDVVSRGLLGLTVGCARCHDHKYDPIPTSDYYALYGVFENCIEELRAIPADPSKPTIDSAYETELAGRKMKLADSMAEKRLEANCRLRNRVGEYLLSQQNLDLYPEMTFNQITPKEDLIPALVRRWQSFLIQAKKESHPVFDAWTVYASIPDEAFTEQAKQVHDRLTNKMPKWNAHVRESFQTAPSSIDEVASRYQALSTMIEKKWDAEIERSKQLNRPLPNKFQDQADEELRQAFYGLDSPCVMPEGSLLVTENYWDYKTLLDLWKLHSDVDKWLLQSNESIDRAPHVVTLIDRQQRLEPQIFRRGNPANKGEIVSRHMLTLGEPITAVFQEGSGRWELANAIIDPANPLTARVWVNRIWAHHFGVGLVSTPSDFGIRANQPSHPDLLDWLAHRLVALNWSTKALHREILLSKTFQQASASESEWTPEQQANWKRACESDPENHLLARMNPRKLSIEAYRDSLLVVSNELDRTRGGLGSDLFGKRRSVYLAIDRQFLPSVLSVFDMANPDLHSSQRTETTIPQQALFALNHAFVIDRAKTIARSIPLDLNRSQRSQAAFEAILRRPPSAVELNEMDQFLEQSESAINETPQDAYAARFRSDWAYGYGPIEPETGMLQSFERIPQFNGTTWQGGYTLPDARIGWIYLDEAGGHPGNDHNHAVVRRWTAPESGTVSVSSELIHRHAISDGISAWIGSSRDGILRSAKVHNRSETMAIETCRVEKGDTIDFIVDLADELNTDQFEWTAIIQLQPHTFVDTQARDAAPMIWDSRRDFTKPKVDNLSPLEQLSHALLMSNEFMFVD